MTNFTDLSMNMESEWDTIYHPSMYPKTDNVSDANPYGPNIEQHEELMGFYETASTLRNIFLPLIVIIGITGNTITIAVFLSTHMKQSSATAFLATLAVVDNVFLFSLFTTWFDGTAVNILRTESACQFIYYVTSVTSFLSVWNVVGFTTERYMAICHPLKAPIFCTQFREKIAVCFLITISCFIYNYAIWTTEVIYLNGVYRCGHKFTYIGFLEKVTWIDTVITMLIPFVLILFMNIKVVCRAAVFHRKRKHCLKPNDSFYSNRSRSKTLRSKPQMRVTRTLVLVSTTFLVLNLPSHVLRLYTLILYTASKTQQDLKMHHYLLREITMLLYYSTFSVNFFLYALYGKHFQGSLKLMFQSLKKKCGCKNHMQCESNTSCKTTYTK